VNEIVKLLATTSSMFLRDAKAVKDKNQLEQFFSKVFHPVFKFLVDKLPNQDLSYLREILNL
jgi:hypothetical protein